MSGHITTIELDGSCKIFELVINPSNDCGFCNNGNTKYNYELYLRGVSLGYMVEDGEICLKCLENYFPEIDIDNYKKTESREYIYE